RSYKCNVFPYDCNQPLAFLSRYQGQMACDGKPNEDGLDLSTEVCGVEMLVLVLYTCVEVTRFLPYRAKIIKSEGLNMTSKRSFKSGHVTLAVHCKLTSTFSGLLNDITVYQFKSRYMII
ncbi:hypothetical protein L9F63_003501, partial [Diploptera punctata]